MLVLYGILVRPNILSIDIVLGGSHGYSQIGRAFE
jgi:hypothetical protein